MCVCVRSCVKRSVCSLPHSDACVWGTLPLPCCHSLPNLLLHHVVTPSPISSSTMLSPPPQSPPPPCCHPLRNLLLHHVVTPSTISSSTPQAVLNPDLPDPEEAQAQEQEEIDSAEPLTDEEMKEKEDLLQQVRGGWRLRHLTRRSCRCTQSCQVAMSTAKAVQLFVHSFFGDALFVKGADCLKCVAV